MGGWSNTMKKVTEASAATKKLLIDQKQSVMDYFKREGANLQIQMFEPESFKTQVVAGMNYTVIYRISITMRIEVRFWRKLDGSVVITGASEPYAAELDKNKQTGELLLKKFEDNAKATMEGLLKNVRKNVDDEDLNKKYYKARAIYNEIAEKTGADSPAKTAERIAVQKAVVNKRKADIIKCVKKVTTMNDFTDNLKKIEVEPVVVKSIETVKDEEDMVEAVAEAKEDPEIATELAKGLVEAKDDEEVAEAIVKAQTKARVKKDSTTYGKLKIQEAAKAIVVKVRNDIVVKKAEEEAEKELDEAEEAEDENKMEEVVKKIQKRGEEMVVKVEKEITERTKNA
jgi:hypothetical protein